MPPASRGLVSRLSSASDSFPCHTTGNQIRPACAYLPRYHSPTHAPVAMIRVSKTDGRRAKLVSSAYSAVIAWLRWQGGCPSSRPNVMVSQEAPHRFGVCQTKGHHPVQGWLCRSALAQRDPMPEQIIPAPTTGAQREISRRRAAICKPARD